MVEVSFSHNNLTEISVDGLVGHWNFSDPNNLTKAKIGEPLQLVGNQSATVGPFEATEIGMGSYYVATHGISSNGGGNQVNKYSIVMDIKIPKSQLWHALYQTNSEKILMMQIGL